MEPDPPLNGEFMRGGAPLFDWEMDLIKKRREGTSRQPKGEQAGEPTWPSPEQRTTDASPVRSLWERLKALSEE